MFKKTVATVIEPLMKAMNDLAEIAERRGGDAVMFEKQRLDAATEAEKANKLRNKLEALLAD